MVGFGRIEKLVKYSSEIGFYDIKYPFGYGKENIYFMFLSKINSYSGI